MDGYIGLVFTNIFSTTLLNINIYIIKINGWLCRSCFYYFFTEH